MVDIVDVYDPLQVSPEDARADGCLSSLTDSKAQTVVVVEGSSFGGDSSLCTVSLVSLDGADTQPCDICHMELATQGLVRCITRASRGRAYNLTVEVVGQVSAPVLYDYQVLVQVRDGCWLWGLLKAS